MRRDTSWRMLLAAFFLLMLAVSMAHAAIDAATAQKLLAEDGGIAHSFFGSSVALSADGSTALIGSYGNNSAYVFVRTGSTWVQQARLTAADAGGNGEFGRSVSLSADGSTALIGAYQDDSYKGSAYVFVRTGSSWNQQTKLTAVDSVAGDRFGYAVSLSADGGTALIGAISACNNSICSGSAYGYLEKYRFCQKRHRIIRQLQRTSCQEYQFFEVPLCVCTDRFKLEPAGQAERI